MKKMRLVMIGNGMAGVRTLEELLKSMRDHDIQTNSLVTTGEGKLLGVISRADAEATLAHEAAAETQADR